MTHSCFDCLFGGDGEEVHDWGHCWKHNGEADYIQPPKETGCEEWKEKLKPCPFCGSPAEFYGEENMVWVRCSNYDCQCRLITCFDEPEEAAEEWNKRAKDSVIVRCKSGCFHLKHYPGSYYEPPSEDCEIKCEAFEKLNISPEAGEDDDGDYPDCPFFLSTDEVERYFWSYHEYQKLVPDLPQEVFDADL